MELIDNISKTLKDDLADSIHSGSKISIAAACFSIYAFQALKDQLTQIDELRFIFTSPTFIAEKAKKERREFYIPRLTRERSLYGTEFEIRLRNELTQKAIAKECADWIRAKVTFKSNISDKSIQGQLVVDDAGYTPINGFTTVELGCEKGNAMNTTIVKDASLAKTLLAGFFVILVSLKKKEYDDKTIAMLFRMIDNKMILVLEYEGESRVAIFHGKLIQTDWKPTDAFSYSLQGLNLDSVWNNLVVQIGDIKMEVDRSLDEQIAVDDQRAKIQKEIERLERLARAEKQPKKKFEMVQQIKALRKHLDEL